MSGAGGFGFGALTGALEGVGIGLGSGDDWIMTAEAKAAGAGLVR